MNPLIALKRSNMILYCHHWMKTVNFYKKQMCLPVVFENEWFIEFQLTETSFLSVADSARATISDVQGQGITLTLEVSDIEMVKAQLGMQKIATTSIRRRWGAFVFYCYDPEGHRLEFWANEDGTGDSLNE